MTHHVLKTLNPYFQAMLEGTKTFEVRRNDRSFQTGDTLTLWLPVKHAGDNLCQEYPCRWEHSTPTINFEVTYVYSGDPRWPALQSGYVVLGLGSVEDVTELESFCRDARNMQEMLRDHMLAQPPVTDERDTYADGYIQGIAHAVGVVDGALGRG